MFLVALAVLGLGLTSCSGDDEPQLPSDGPGQTDTSTGQSNVITGGEVSGVWKAGSTVRVKGSFEIPQGKSLTIEKGVNVIVEQNTQVPVEIMVYGDLYCLGEEGNEITFSIPEELKAQNPKRVWGGIFAADNQKKAPDMVFQYTTIEYTGALTTNNSYSAHTFKSTVGKGVPAINTMDQNTNLVIQHCTFRHNGQDGLYLQGGNMIITNNVFEGQGDEAGGEGVNFKAGIVLDLAYNLFYSPSNSAVKMSGTTDNRTPGNFTVFNNTVINGGGRKNNADLGSFAIESGCSAYIYNNLLVNCRWGILDNVTDPAKESIISNNYYYGYTQSMVDNFQASAANPEEETGIAKGEINAVKGMLAQENDPMFVAYDLSTPATNDRIESSYDFHLQANSPALSAGAAPAEVAKKIHFAENGLTINGVTYKTPQPSAYCGAFGAE